MSIIMPMISEPETQRTNEITRKSIPDESKRKNGTITLHMKVKIGENRKTGRVFWPMCSMVLRIAVGKYWNENRPELTKKNTISTLPTVSAVRLCGVIIKSKKAMTEKTDCWNSSRNLTLLRRKTAPARKYMQFTKLTAPVKIAR